MKYADFFTNFQSHPDTLQLVMKTDDRAIAQSIRNLVMTNKGDRPFENNVGGEVGRMLFEPMANHITDAMKQFILETLKLEPRAVIEEVVVEARELQNAYVVVIVYSTANSQAPQAVELTLYRAR